MLVRLNWKGAGHFRVAITRIEQHKKQKLCLISELLMIDVIVGKYGDKVGCSTHEYNGQLFYHSTSYEWDRWVRCYFIIFWCCYQANYINENVHHDYDQTFA